jgi:HEPN domain-containing protein
MNLEEKIKFWFKSSMDDLATAENLLENKRYTWALFLLHISLEKRLKGYFFKKKNVTPPYTHDLNRLASKAELNLSLEQKDLLDEISAFNIQARYDDYKEEFKKKCTEEFARQYFMQAKDFIIWIDKQL